MLMNKFSTNLRKYLPKITKRDKVLDSIQFYRAIVNDELTPCFQTKFQLFEALTEKYKDFPIQNVVIQKVILQTIK